MTDESDLGDALTTLADSAAGLSTDLDGLSDAVTQLQDSTRRLSEQQATVATEMEQTADRLSSVDAHSLDTTQRSDPVAGD
jgi:uncharacterized phage infection (PIP) family protein YhgE